MKLVRHLVVSPGGLRCHSKGFGSISDSIDGYAGSPGFTAVIFKDAFEARRTISLGVHLILAVCANPHICATAIQPNPINVIDL